MNFNFEIIQETPSSNSRGFMKKIFINLSLVLTLFACSQPNALILVQAGRSDFVIVLAGDASPSEQHAARDFQKHIQQMSGTTLPILPLADAPQSYRIFIGANPLTDSLLPGVKMEFGDEEFLIRTAGTDLFLLGGKKRGTMYGVVSLLEKYWGCRWYTQEVSRIPAQSTLRLPEINERQRPAFEYRMPFFTEAMKTDWAIHNKINGFGADLPPEVGGQVKYAKNYLGHTFYALVPPEKYFARHPEYFSMVKGKRVGDRAQLCLTNPGTRQAAIQQIETWLQEDPEARIVSITQNDWEDWCECPECQALDEREGSHAASLVAFVNAIADSLGPKYPDILFDTFAYTYTQKPPRTLKVRDNVIIRLCHMQPSCDAHPLIACALNTDYVQHLREWRQKGGKLYVWHYVTDFSHYLLPFPNFNAIREDIPFYWREGVDGVFCQGNSAEGGGGEWAELRAYVLAKLLWNPETDVDAVIDDFLQGVYGAAAKPIRQYFDLIHAQVQSPEMHFNLFSNPDEVGYLTPELIAKYHARFDEAEQRVADSPEILARVEKARLPVYYADLWFQGQRQILGQATVDSVMFVKFKRLVARNGIRHQSERSEMRSFLQVLSSECRFIRQLKIIGPFDAPKSNLLGTAQPPESEIDFTQTYAGVAGVAVNWRDWTDKGGAYVDFTKIFSPDSIGVAYALCYLHAPREFSTQLGIGSNDGVRVFLNDQLVHDHAALRKATPNSDIVKVQFDPGWNKLLIKIDQIGGGWGLYLSVFDSNKVLTFSTDQKSGLATF